VIGSLASLTSKLFNRKALTDLIVKCLINGGKSRFLPMASCQIRLLTREVNECSVAAGIKTFELMGYKFERLLLIIMGASDWR
jgi:hypothetical protein